MDLAKLKVQALLREKVRDLKNVYQHFCGAGVDSDAGKYLQAQISGTVQVAAGFVSCC